jgi:hypothetical protein
MNSARRARPTGVGADPDEFCLFDRRLPASFERRVVVVCRTREHTVAEAEWRDAIVVVASGTIELECRGGGRHRFDCGDILWLAELPLLALHNPGSDATVLLSVSRTRDDFSVAAPSED